MSMPETEAKTVKCATPFLAARGGDVVAYRLLGIRRRGLAPEDMGYWFVQFEPRSGLGIVTDRPSRFSLVRSLVASGSGSSNGATGATNDGWHRIDLVREDQQTYWTGFCPRTERELELRFAEIDRHGEHEIDLIPPATENTRPRRRPFWPMLAALAFGAALWAIIIWGLIGFVRAVWPG